MADFAELKRLVLDVVAKADQLQETLGAGLPHPIDREQCDECRYWVPEKNTVRGEDDSGDHSGTLCYRCHMQRGRAILRRTCAVCHYDFPDAQVAIRGEKIVCLDCHKRIDRDRTYE